MGRLYALSLSLSFSCFDYMRWCSYHIRIFFYLNNYLRLLYNICSCACVDTSFFFFFSEFHHGSSTLLQVVVHASAIYCSSERYSNSLSLSLQQERCSLSVPLPSSLSGFFFIFSSCVLFFFNFKSVGWHIILFLRICLLWGALVVMMRTRCRISTSIYLLLQVDLSSWIAIQSASDRWMRRVCMRRNFAAGRRLKAVRSTSSLSRISTASRKKSSATYIRIY